MAITYTGYDGDGYAVEVDFTNSEINCSDSIDTLTIQDLNDVLREAEASAIGMGHGTICNTSGKENLDIDTGVQVGITLELLGDWVIYSEKTSGTFKVTGGNLLRHDGSDPFKANVLITYVVILSAASTVVQISTGSGLSTEEHNQLMGLPTTTLETDERTQLLAIPTEAGLTTEEHYYLLGISQTGGLTAQQTRDAMKLAASAGEGAAGSIDRMVKDIHSVSAGDADLNDDKTVIIYKDEDDNDRLTSTLTNDGRTVTRN